MGRPARVVKPKVVPAGGTKKVTPPKPPITKNKAKNPPTSTKVAVADPEDDTTAPVDAEYDTDELAEFPTDSESEPVDSEPGEEKRSSRGTMTINIKGGRRRSIGPNKY